MHESPVSHRAAIAKAVAIMFASLLSIPILWCTLRGIAHLLAHLGGQTCDLVLLYVSWLYWIPIALIVAGLGAMGALVAIYKLRCDEATENDAVTSPRTRTATRTSS